MIIKGLRKLKKRLKRPFNPYMKVENQVLTDEEINEVIKGGDVSKLRPLYQHKSLTKEQINTALNKRKCLSWIYEYHALTDKQIDKALEINKHLNHLYQSQTLNEQHIDKAIAKGRYLDNLRKNQELTDKHLTTLNL